jgi:hypothetical protein
MTFLFEKQQREVRLSAFATATAPIIDFEAEPARLGWLGFAETELDSPHGQKRDSYYHYHLLTCFDPVPVSPTQGVVAVRTTDDDLLKFRKLRDAWYVERGITSSATGLVMCPSYLSIIGMGPAALRYILAQMVEEGDDPDHWFTALEAITGVNPVPVEAYGDTVAMTRLWFRWALENHAG